MPFFLHANQSTVSTRPQNLYTTYVFIIIGFSLLLRLFYIGSNDLLVEEAYYWNYAQHLDFSYLDHPPMVAFLIKITTFLAGTNEFSVRLPTLFCWILTAFFSFKLTHLLSRGAGQYALLLLAVLPFFFLQSLVITPDQPLMACWSAALYCLYRSAVLDESRYWYAVGIWVGLGLLSKYTIVLLGPATLLYLCMVPAARGWLSRKEPYVSALIALLFFTPVIYWNANHEWISFLFQTTRRLDASYTFALHHLLGLLVLFLTPLGVVGLGEMFKKTTIRRTNVEIKAIRFFQAFTLLPLIFFGLFSLTHEVKFNWIGPGLLAVIPWLAVLIKQSAQLKKPILLNGWLITSIILIFSYSSILFVIRFGTPEWAYQTFFPKFIAWSDLSRQINAIANKVERRAHSTPIIIPLDRYEINSEFQFYQAMLLAHGDIQKSYSIQGQHVFGGNSLMYQYWSHNEKLTGKTLIIVSTKLTDFESPVLKQRIITSSQINKFWSHNRGRATNITPYYYQVATMK